MVWPELNASIPENGFSLEVAKIHKFKYRSYNSKLRTFELWYYKSMILYLNKNYLPYTEN